MLRLLVSPKWIAWHVLTLGAMVACGFLAAWQWGRAGSALGSAVNIGYGVQWPFFALFFAFMWWRFLRIELEQLPKAGRFDDGPVPEPRADAAVPEAGVAGAAAVVDDPEPAPRDDAARPAPVVDDGSSPFTARPPGVGLSNLSDPQIRAYNEALAELAARDREN